MSSVLIKNDVNIEPPTAVPSLLNYPLENVRNPEFQKLKIDQSLN